MEQTFARFSDDEMQTLRNALARSYGEDVAQEALVRSLLAHKFGGLDGLTRLAWRVARRLYLDVKRGWAPSQREERLKTAPLEAAYAVGTEPEQLRRAEARQILDRLDPAKVALAFEGAAGTEIQPPQARLHRWVLRKEIRDAIAGMGLTAMSLAASQATPELLVPQAAPSWLLCGELVGAESSEG